MRSTQQNWTEDGERSHLLPATPVQRPGLLSQSSTRTQCNGPGSFTVIYANQARMPGCSHHHLRDPSATGRAPSPLSMQTLQGSRAALTVIYANPVKQAGLPHRHLPEPSKEAGLLSSASTRSQHNKPGSLAWTRYTKLGVVGGLMVANDVFILREFF